MYSLIFMYYNYIEKHVCKCFLGASLHRCSYALKAVCRGCSMFQSLEAARDFDFRTYSHIFPIFFQYVSNIFPIFVVFGYFMFAFSSRFFKPAKLHDAAIPCQVVFSVQGMCHEYSCKIRPGHRHSKEFVFNMRSTFTSQ